MSTQTDKIIRFYYTLAPLLAYTLVTLYFVLGLVDGNVNGPVGIVAAAILILCAWPVFKFFIKLGDPLPYYRLKSLGASVISAVIIYFLARPTNWASFETSGNGFTRVIHYSHSYALFVPAMLFLIILLIMFVTTLITAIYGD